MAGRGAVTVPVPSRRWGLSMGLTCESFPSSSHQHHLHAAHTSISSLSSHSGFSDAALRCAKIPPDCVDCVGNAWRDLCGRERNLQGDDSDLDEEDIRGWISEFLLSENDVTNFKSLCQEAPNTLQLRRVLNFYWKKSSKVSDMLEVIGSRKLGQIKREERSALQSRIRRELEEFKKEEETIHQSWEECKLIGAPNAQSEQENKRIVKEAEQSKRITGLNLLEMRSKIKQLRDIQLLHRNWFQKREEAMALCSNSFSVGDEPESSVMEAINAGQRAFSDNAHKGELFSEFSELLGSAAVVYVHSAMRSEARREADAGKRYWAIAARLWEQQMKYLIQVWGRDHGNVSKCFANVKMAQQKSGMIFS